MGFPTLEADLSKAIKDSEQSSKDHAKTIADLRAKLGKSCTHPMESQFDFQWEHDNGYGRQTMVTGVYCKLCLAEKHWKTSSLWTYQERAS